MLWCSYLVTGMITLALADSYYYYPEDQKTFVLFYHSYKTHIHFFFSLFFFHYKISIFFLLVANSISKRYLVAITLNAVTYVYSWRFNDMKAAKVSSTVIACATLPLDRSAQLSAQRCCRVNALGAFPPSRLNWPAALDQDSYTCVDCLECDGSFIVTNMGGFIALRGQ